MSLHFHSLRIKEVRKETPECVSVVFDIPESLQKEFQFHQGQSLTMRTWINEEEIRRTYSICSSPLEQEWRVAIKKQEKGLFSTFANEKLRAGDTLDVMEPVGKFYTELNPSHKKNYLAFASGSGITPVISIIKTTLQSEPESRFTLVYGNRNRSSIIFFEELEGLKNKYMGRLNLLYVLSREKTESPASFGRINTEKLDDLSRILNYQSFDETFICGPEEMIFCVRDYLLAKKIDEKKIHFELFTTAGSRKKPQTSDVKPDSGPKSAITLKVDGRSIDIPLSMNSELSILDAALQHGADLPYACKGGMCCTCKALLVEGEVVMDVHWGLEHEEVEKGYILTCQSHPKTEKVVVDFDIK